jgi:hypothetical protein
MVKREWIVSLTQMSVQFMRIKTVGTNGLIRNVLAGDYVPCSMVTASPPHVKRQVWGERQLRKRLRPW